MLNSSWFFFTGLTAEINKRGLPEEPDTLSPELFCENSPPRANWLAWRDSWCSNQQLAQASDSEEITAIPNRLNRWNLSETPIRSKIESLWLSIDQDENWQPFQAWLKTVCLD